MKVVYITNCHVIAVYSTWSLCKIFIPVNVTVVYSIITFGVYISG